MSNHTQGFDYHVDMAGHRIGSLADPLAGPDAATKAYVDAQIAALRAELLGISHYAMGEAPVTVSPVGTSGE